jgi:hypothetical protein
LGKDPSSEKQALRNSLTLAQLCDDYGQQRFLKIGRFGVFTPEQARQEARRVLIASPEPF